MTARWCEPIDVRRIPLATLIAIVVAFAVDVGILEAGQRWLDVPAEEPLLSLVAIGVAVLVAAVLAGLGLVVLAGTQARPLSTFRSATTCAVVISCMAPLLARAGWIAGDSPISTPTMTIMLLMHVATGAVFALFLTSLPRANAPRRY